MRRLIELAVKHTFYVNLIGGTICVVGLVVLWNMKRDLIPPLQFPVVEVAASLPGASPSEVESLVTFPIEEAIGSLEGLKNTKSTSYPGGMTISLEFQAAFSDQLDSSVQLVRDRITGIQHRLPRDLRPVQVRQDRITDIYLASLAVEGADVLNPQHRAAIFQVRSQLAAMRGISNIDVWMRERNLFVRLMPEALKKFDISVAKARQVLVEHFRFQSIGHFKSNGNDFSVQLESPELDTDALGDLSLSMNSLGQGVKLKDVAKLEWDSWTEHQRWLRDGKRVAVLDVRKDTLSDSIKLYDRLLERVHLLQNELPAGLRLEVMFDGPRFIKKQIQVLSQNGWVGFIFVLLLLGYFLGFKVSLMALWGMPVAYLGTFVVLSWIGISIDLLSILGIILVVGIIVDDAIIVAERYTKLLGQGLKAQEAARVAARELVVPVTGTVLTTIVAFLPILLVKDNMTWFLQAIPLVVIVSMIFSWVESFFILPNHLAHFVKTQPPSRGDGVMAVVEGFSAKLLQVFFKYRYLVLLSTFAFVGAAVFVASKKLQHHFNVSVGSEQIWIRMALKNSSSLDHTEKVIRPVIEFAKSFPKDLVEYSSTRIGRIHQDGLKKEGYRYARIVIGINGHHPRPIKVKEQLLPKVKEALAKLKTDEYEFLEAEERKRGEEDFRKNTLAISIEGISEKRFLEAEKSIQAGVMAKEGIKLKTTVDDDYMDQWIFVPDLDRLSQYGLDRYSVSSQIKEYVAPYEVGQLRSGGETVSILTEMVGAGESYIHRLDNLELSNQMGEKIPLKWIGQWMKERVRKGIEHKDGMKFAEVPFQFDEKYMNLETARQYLQEQLKPIKALFPSLNLSVENANQREEENKSWTMKVVFYSLVGVFVVLALFTGSMSLPFLVLAPAPLGMMGAFLMLYLHGQSLTMMGMIGLMGVIGVAVNDSIVLLHKVRGLRETTSWAYSQVVMEAVKSRLRAILLTSLTTLGGLLPTAYGVFGESGFTQPIAFTMGWGLFFSTVITVTCLPCYLLILDDTKSGLLKLWRRISFSANQEEDPVSTSAADPADVVASVSGGRSELGGPPEAVQ